MIVYKLTTQDGKTRYGRYNETQWGEGIEHTAPGGTPGECGIGWLHAYHSPSMAALMNVAHVGIDSPLCWECDADVVEDRSDKLLCTRIKTIRCVDLPEMSDEQRVEIVIRAAIVVYDNPSWVQWARNWLNGTDRSELSAHAAMESTIRVAHESYISWRLLAAVRAAAAASLMRSAASRVPVAAAESVRSSAIGTLDLNGIINGVLQRQQTDEIKMSGV